MERIMVSAYRPYKGKEEVFKSLFFSQVAILREEGFLSDRDPWFMRAKDGTYLCFLEWKSWGVADKPGTNPKVQKLWMQFEKICSFEKPASIPEFQQMFSLLEALKPE